MRRIERTTAFRRDFRREQRGRYRNLDKAVAEIVTLLAEDMPATVSHATTPVAPIPLLLSMA